MKVPYLASGTLLVLLLAIPGIAVALPACPPEGWSADSLRKLKAGGFVVAQDERRRRLALGLAPCLAEPDPSLRDGITFEAYSTWLRAGLLDQATRLELLQQLLPAIAPGQSDAGGFRQPFSALVLAELARADRKSAYLSPEQRQALVEAAAGYLESVRDYRGYDPQDGWRHGVAHGSDLLMQLALNEALGKAQLDRILQAVKQQVAPPGDHFYIYGESERLARPVLFVAMRGLHSPEEWTAWFGQIASPAPLPGWDQAYQSNAGLARRHNTRAFLLVIYSEIRDSKNENLARLAPMVAAVLAKVP
ncbi:MAG: DUF2785 domain-containing protein [Arenimonas sp.]|nr:DUF2785 domain-containing protein [Arenimonas sp.]